MPGDVQQLLGKSLGGYHLTARLGTSASSVYSAIDGALGREVALKVLPPLRAAQPDAAERFRAEARRAAAFTHPHVVPIYQIGEEDGYLFIVMPLLAESLRDRLARTQHFDVAAAVQLVAQIASALDALHRQGVIHGAVRPEHILFTDDGVPQLSTLGLARELPHLATHIAPDDPEGLATLPHQAVTAMHYSAPEQLLPAGASDQRTDIYALGAVLYELLAGAAPPEPSARRDGVPRPIPPPSASNPRVPAAFDRIILQALAREPAERYPDIERFLLALEAALREQTTPHSSGFTVEDIVSAQTIPTVALMSWPWRFDDDAKRSLIKARVVVIAAACLLLLASITGGTALLLNRAASASTTPVPSIGPTSTPSPLPTPSPTAAPLLGKTAILVSPSLVDAPDCSGIVPVSIRLSTKSVTALQWLIQVAAGPPLAIDKTRGTVAAGKPVVIKILGITTNGLLRITSPQARPTSVTVPVSCG
jgi:serine/threonine protein kinase